MNTDLILFLEENGFVLSKTWTSEFHKRMHSKYAEELNVSISVIWNKDLMISVWGKTFADFVFLVKSKKDVQNKIKKILDILDEIIKANVSGHSIGHFYDYEEISNGSFTTINQYEDILVSRYAVVDISGDEAILEKRKNYTCKVCDNVY